MPENMERRFSVARIYDPDPGGYRVLVDRLWPRGVSKDAAALDEWARDVAPSGDLRRWYGHDPSRFEEFARRYGEELGAEPAATVVDHLLDVAADRRVVLLTATRDVALSAARVLADHLGQRGRWS